MAFQEIFTTPVEIVGGLRAGVPAYLVTQPKPEARSRYKPVGATIGDLLAPLYKIPHQELIHLRRRVFPL